MKIAILGSGHIGSALARAFAAAKHQVVFGRRNFESTAAAPLGVRVETIGDAITNADAVVVAWPARAVPDLIDSYREGLAGALIVDTTNTLTGPPHDPRHTRTDMFQADRWGTTTTRVYRAFCTLGVESLRPRSSDEAPIVFPYAGPADLEDQSIVESLITATGNSALWLGTIHEAAPALDGLARAWFLAALTRGLGRDVKVTFTGSDSWSSQGAHS